MAKNKDKDSPPIEPSFLQRLPQRFDTWQVDARSLEVSLKDGDRTIQPWMIVVASESEGQILGFEVVSKAPTAKKIWEVLLRALTKPAVGKPRRPTEVQVLSDKRMLGLEPYVAELGIGFTTTEDLGIIDQVIDALTEELVAERQPALLDAPNVTPKLVAGVFDAAATYFKQAPWNKVGEQTIQVECAKFAGSPWYAIMMGQAGMTAGLALYDSLETLNRIKEGDLDEEETARLTSALVLIFGEEEDLAEADAESIRQYHWKVAGSEAYPSIYRKEEGQNMRPPLGEELELLEGCLRALLVFVKRSKPTSSDPMPISVAVATGELSLTLTWLPE